MKKYTGVVTLLMIGIRSQIVGGFRIRLAFGLGIIQVNCSSQVRVAAIQSVSRVASR